MLKRREDIKLIEAVEVMGPKFYLIGQNKYAILQTLEELKMRYSLFSEKVSDNPKKISLKRKFLNYYVSFLYPPHSLAMVPKELLELQRLLTKCLPLWIIIDRVLCADQNIFLFNTLDMFE